MNRLTPWLDERPTPARRDFFDAECAEAGVTPSEYKFRQWLDRHLDAMRHEVQCEHDNMTRNDPKPAPHGINRADEEESIWEIYRTRQ